MATLHIPYYRSDVPVVRYTENINSGVMVIQEDENHINYICGTLLTPTSNYFKTTDSQNTYSSILCKTNDNPSCLGSFDLPDKNNSGSYVLTYSNPTKDAKYTWTNIEDIALSKCFTSSTGTIYRTSSLIISYKNSAFHFDNTKYVYNLLIDGYVDIGKDIATTNDIVKQNSNIFVLINDSSASNLSSITSDNGGINLSLFYKYTANVTDTTTTKKRLCKFIPDFKTAKTEKQTDICLTLITANMLNNVPNNIQQLKPLDIVCSIMITENHRPTS